MKETLEKLDFKLKMSAHQNIPLKQKHKQVGENIHNI